MELRKGLGRESGVDYPKLAMFPALIGLVVADQITTALESLGHVDRLLADRRGILQEESPFSG
jgi:hypothetical protein